MRRIAFTLFVLVVGLVLASSAQADCQSSCDVDYNNCVRNANGWDERDLCIDAREYCLGICADPTCYTDVTVTGSIQSTTNQWIRSCSGFNFAGQRVTCSFFREVQTTTPWTRVDRHYCEAPIEYGTRTYGTPTTTTLRFWDNCQAVIGC